MRSIPYQRPIPSCMPKQEQSICERILLRWRCYKIVPNHMLYFEPQGTHLRQHRLAVRSWVVGQLGMEQTVLAWPLLGLAESGLQKKPCNTSREYLPPRCRILQVTLYRNFLRTTRWHLKVPMTACHSLRCINTLEKWKSIPCRQNSREDRP